MLANIAKILHDRDFRKRLEAAHSADDILRIIREMEYVPEELTGLETLLSDTYFCNFSIFQSMPDSWAVKQLFPIMPISRLAERPTREATLVDITCDSDGKIDQFIDRRDVKRTLLLHEYDGKPYAGRFNHVPGMSSCTDCHEPHAGELHEEKCGTCHQGAKRGGEAAAPQIHIGCTHEHSP